MSCRNDNTKNDPGLLAVTEVYTTLTFSVTSSSWSPRILANTMEISTPIHPGCNSAYQYYLISQPTREDLTSLDHCCTNIERRSSHIYRTPNSHRYHINMNAIWQSHPSLCRSKITTDYQFVLKWNIAKEATCSNTSLVVTTHSLINFVDSIEVLFIYSNSQKDVNASPHPHTNYYHRFQRLQQIIDS